MMWMWWMLVFIHSRSPLLGHIFQEVSLPLRHSLTWWSWARKVLEGAGGKCWPPACLLSSRKPRPQWEGRGAGVHPSSGVGWWELHGPWPHLFIGLLPLNTAVSQAQHLSTAPGPDCDHCPTLTLYLFLLASVSKSQHTHEPKIIKLYLIKYTR